MEKEKTKKTLLKSLGYVLSVKKKIQLGIAVLAAVVVLGTAGYIAGQVRRNNDENARIATVSTLEKVVNVSELSTFTAIYNGIAEVPRPDKPEKTDYYVAYNAQIKAGFDFEGIDFSIEDQEKKIRISIPPVRITDISVDMSSLDFIFYNKDKNASAVSEEAYKACVADAKTESANKTAILDLAKENAENVIGALIAPIIRQYNSEYEMSMEWRAE